MLIARAGAAMPFLSDDALISLRYAARLLGGQGLTWTDGPPVEGYSNLLWVLMAALGGALGFDLVDTVRVLGVACMAAVVGAVAAWTFRAEARTSGPVGGALGLVFFATAAPVSVWAVGGLEQPLVAALLASCFPLYWRAAQGGFQSARLAAGLAALLGALCLTRPDGPLFAAALAAAAGAGWTETRGRVPWRFWAIALAGPALCVGAQLAFRLLTYGEIVPNTALVKLDPSPHHAFGGLRYVAGGMWGLAPASLLAVALLIAGTVRASTRRAALPLLTTGALWTLYLVVIGGDIFPAHRHMVPLVVVMTYALAQGASAVWSDAGGRRRAGATALVGAVVLATAALQPSGRGSTAAANERWEWKGRSLALTLRAAYADRAPLLGVTAAGALPYWTEFPAVDLLGLNDHYLPRHKPDAAGTGFLGHELGDAAYLLRRAPDLVVFTVGAGDPFAFRYAGALGPGGPYAEAYAAAYAPVRVQTAVEPVYVARVWFRRDSQALGVRVSAGRIEIPAPFLSENAHTVAVLSGARLVVPIDARRPAVGVLPGVEGAWTVQVVGEGATVAMAEPTPDGLRVRVEARRGRAVAERVVLTRR